ncbi:hypothetical protein DB41_FI00220 [Neochlamydia sp. TUME1]|uniref:hypothetical protein n=1 Tax=Neochlamydia sp. TUME1 TaxID=1478174 RepID=UPI00057D85F0|nr:hypothetical protein [Neochlamydia sp. TUME1]KIC76612.1 hypothetical protein DB41_FI00220 [Neochlamydia sp. TUME1]
MLKIEIPKRAAHCMHGNEPLIPEMEFYSILLFQEEEYQRKDFCLACWEKFAKEDFSTTAKTAWKAKVVSKKEKEEISFKTRDEKAFYLLKNLLQSPSEEEWAEAFILALYLARRKIIYLRQELPQENGSVVAIYEVAATEEMWAVKRKPLSSSDIKALQVKIAEKLSR